MGYKRVTLNTIIGIIIISASTLVAGYLTAYHKEPFYLLFLLLIPFVTIYIINNFNQSNHQIAFFFDAIRNDDSSLKFPTSIKQKSLRYLYHSLNSLNERITEIKLKNEYLEKYYQAFIQHADTGLIALNQNNEVEIMNEKAFEYAGIPSFVPLHLIAMKNMDLFNTITQITSEETRIYKRFSSENQINLLIRSKEIRFGNKVSKLISLQDIRHELDEKELDSWQKLIRVLTHEIMNSIAPIVSLTGTLRNFFVNEDKSIHTHKVDQEIIENVVEGLEIIEERSKGLVNFVNSYRELTRIPKPEFESILIKDWISHILLLLKEQMDIHQITVECNIDSKVSYLSGDRKLLTQVIINIINNAREALIEIPENRKLWLSIEKSKQNQTLISISNNGPVIPEETMEKIFIPFFTTKGQGSGIGLSLSRQILKLHKGYIHVESTEKMTKFIIML